MLGRADGAGAGVSQPKKDYTCWAQLPDEWTYDECVSYEKQQEFLGLGLLCPGLNRYNYLKDIYECEYCGVQTPRIIP